MHVSISRPYDKAGRLIDGRDKNLTGYGLSGVVSAVAPAGTVSVKLRVYTAQGDVSVGTTTLIIDNGMKCPFLIQGAASTLGYGDVVRFGRAFAKTHFQKAFDYVAPF